MAKGSGGTRSNGAGAGGVVAAPEEDRYAGYREAETSLKYKYNPETVKFELHDPERDWNMKSEITPADLRTKADFSFSSVQRDNNGKFDLGRGDYWFTENMSFAKAIDRAVSEIKTGYRNNEEVRDHYMVIESEGTDLWATVNAQLKADGKVRITISRYKGY